MIIGSNTHMRHRYLPRAVFCFVFLFLYDSGFAQVTIGVTGDLGNRVHYSNPGNFQKRAPSVSATLSINVDELIANDWFLQYNAGIGLLGYTVKTSSVDTLINDPETYFPDRDYATPFLQGGLSIGKSVKVSGKTISITLGGGATYYLDLFGTGLISTTSIWDGSTFEKVFEYQTILVDSRIRAYVQASCQVNITPRICAGLRYQYHFNPVYTGTYQYYHMKDPPAGELAVYQRDISVVVGFRFGKRMG